MKNRVAWIEVISVIFIFLFVYTASNKIFTHNIFVQTLQETPLIGGTAIYIAIFLPVVELSISFLLIIPRTRSWGLYGAFAIMLLFTLYISYMIAFTPNRPCTCGGVLEKMTWPQHLLFNIIFTLLALTGILLISVKQTDL